MASPEHPPARADDERPLRIALSRAEHHRRRRRVALVGALTALVALVAVAATSAGGSGSWDPVRLRDGAIAELPKLRLEAQVQAAAATIARRRRERLREDAALTSTMARMPYVRLAGSQHREVALTFDDGPGPYTERVLDVLRREHVRATFFTVGIQLANFPLALQREVAEGHEIGDHTWNHPNLTRLSPHDVATEIGNEAAALEQAGVPRPRLFRPPYGAFDDAVLASIRRQRMLTVLWTIDTSDYASGSPVALAKYVLDNARPGAIILLHDAGGNRTATADALPLIIRGLHRARYKMVTVPRLLLDNPPPMDQSWVPRASGA
ncbi:MAG TPA: polysaccharide deacetylase family protein [Solirubrobacteraceae bacterium]|nr:polysaccharide deacetylase family protein [Solirubrobacteraceae bacterium]